MVCTEHSRLKIYRQDLSEFSNMKLLWVVGQLLYFSHYIPNHITYLVPRLMVFFY